MVNAFTRRIQQHPRWNILDLGLPHIPLIARRRILRRSLDQVIPPPVIPVDLNHMAQRRRLLHRRRDENRTGELLRAVLKEPAEVIVALDGLAARAKRQIAIVPAKDAVATAVVALLPNAEPVAEVGVLVSAVRVAQTRDAKVDRAGDDDTQR